MEDPSAESNEVQDAVMNSCEVPDNADFLIAHSTLHGIRVHLMATVLKSFYSLTETRYK